MSWSRTFDDPIALPDGGVLKTLLRDRAQGGLKIGLAPGPQAVRGLHVGNVELDP
jgi:hypothetical protein